MYLFNLPITKASFISINYINSRLISQFYSRLSTAKKLAVDEWYKLSFTIGAWCTVVIFLLYHRCSDHLNCTTAKLYYYKVLFYFAWYVHVYIQTWMWLSSVFKERSLNCQLLLILIQPISHHFHFCTNITQNKCACDKQSLKRNIWKKFVKLPQSLLLTVSISERKTKFSLTSTFSLLYLFPFNINSSLLWCLWYVSYTQAFCIFCLMFLLQCSKIKDDIKC